MFNMPRAAININDGFGGGNEISESLLFAFTLAVCTNRHSQVQHLPRKHGPFGHELMVGVSISTHVVLTCAGIVSRS
jgi:hypothetical protein